MDEPSLPPAVPPPPSAAGDRADTTDYRVLNLVLLGVWCLVLVSSVVFGLELRSDDSCFGSCSMDLMIWTAPVWCAAVAGRALGWHQKHPYVIAGVMAGWVLLNLSGARHTLEQMSFILRREDELNEQRVRALRGEVVDVQWGMGSVHRVRVDRGMVFWPSAEWGLGSAGIVHAPKPLERPYGNAFGEGVVGFTHLFGNWYFCGLT